MEENVRFIIGILKIQPELVGNEAVLRGMLFNSGCNKDNVDRVINEANRRIGHLSR